MRVSTMELQHDQSLPTTPTQRGGIKNNAPPPSAGHIRLEENCKPPISPLGAGGRRLRRFRRQATLLLVLLGLLTTILAVAYRRMLRASSLSSSLYHQQHHVRRGSHELPSELWGPRPSISSSSWKDKPTKKTEKVLDVLIIGAGWSGLGAGDKLRRHGKQNFEILEAYTAVGGRSRTVYPFPPKDLPIELGSAWTYTDTEVHEMVEEYGIPHGRIHYKDGEKFGLYESRSFRGDNSNVTAATGEVSDADRKHLIEKEWLDGFIPFSRRQADKLEDTGKDKPYQEVLEEYLQKRGSTLSFKQRQFLKALVSSNIKVEYAASLSEISTSTVGYSVNECVFCGANNYIPVQNGGFGKILAPLANPLKDKIQLGHQVTKIEHSSDDQPVKVTGIDRSTGKPFTKFAETVLVTVSLGVLKANDIEFVPSLPKAKKQAIEYLTFGVLNKCIFYWENKAQASSWWPHGKEWLTLISDNETESGKWTTFFNDKEIGSGGHFGGKADHFVLSAWSGGDDAKAIELESDEAIVTHVLGNLREMLGASVPRPSHYIISRWGHEEFVRGSYSFDPPGRPGQVKRARKDLGERVGKRLFWAGEATNVKSYGTTYGAFRTGVEGAKGILSFLKKQNVTPARLK